MTSRGQRLAKMRSAEWVRFCLTSNAVPRWMIPTGSSYHEMAWPGRIGIVEAMPCPPVPHDVRLTAFSDRAPLSAAWAWLDAWPAASSTEMVLLAEATARVLAEPIVTRGDSPDRPRAAENGYAVRAADCDGANSYNPLVLPLLDPGADELPAGSACPIASGWPLPSGADAVLPLEAAQPAGARSLEVLAPVAPGSGIERWRNALRAGTPVLEPGHRMRPVDVGYLAAMGVDRVAVVRRPRVALVVPGAKYGPDALTPMLRALLARDEALVEVIPVDGAGELALTAALTGIENCELVLAAGRAGTGLDDTAALALRAAGGTLALHGLALRPGGASGLATIQRSGRCHPAAVPPKPLIPILLLPGEPLACLVAYDMLAARLVRRLAGAHLDLPYPVAEFALARKIVSGIGMVEVVPVRLANGWAMPVGADGGLAGAVQADGFVVVPEPSEGYPAAGRVIVHLYETTRDGTSQSGAGNGVMNSRDTIATPEMGS